VELRRFRGARIAFDVSVNLLITPGDLFVKTDAKLAAKRTPYNCRARQRPRMSTNANFVQDFQLTHN
jgi:hypothetical protein